MAKKRKPAKKAKKVTLQDIYNRLDEFVLSVDSLSSRVAEALKTLEETEVVEETTEEEGNTEEGQSE